MVKFCIISSPDEKILVRKVVRLLRGSFEIPRDRITFTFSGYRGSRNNYNLSTLKKEHEESIVIGVITQNSLSSRYVLFDFGVACGFGKSILLLLVGVSIDDLPDLMKQNIVIKAHKRNELFHFIDYIKKSAYLKHNHISSSIEAVGELASYAKDFNEGKLVSSKDKNDIYIIEYGKKRKIESLDYLEKDWNHKIEIWPSYTIKRLKNGNGINSAEIVKEIQHKHNRLK